MCGISGYFVSDAITQTPIVSMAQSIIHRGPDDGGYIFANIDTLSSFSYSSYHSPNLIKERFPVLGNYEKVQSHHLAMAQVRYSIIDLSPSGHQPMWSTCGNYCIIFNGEIYNYLELRSDLSKLGHHFLTTSDTEVFLHGYIQWGDQVFNKLNGFFAVSIYDKKRMAVLLGRDRLGKAHLYYTSNKYHSFHWASEIKALIVAGCVSRQDVKVSAIADFVLYNHRDREGPFWNGVFDFPPGHFAWIDKSCHIEPIKFWTLPVQRLTTDDISMDESIIRLENLLTDSLLIRLRADVPIGFELSGGMDSSALVGLAVGKLGKNIKTYTIAFNEPGSNEECYARVLAKQYSSQIDYTVINPPKEEFWQGANEFVWQQEEPFHSPNLYTSQCMQRIIKESGSHVVISGAAGDEMLAGYPGVYQAPYLRHLLSEGSISSFFHEIYASTDVKPHKAIRKLILDFLLNEERQELLRMYTAGELTLLKSILSKNVFGEKLLKPSTSMEMTFHGRTIANMTYRMMNYWLRSGMKSSYGIPIEPRSPFLDYRVVEFCTTLPPQYLIHDGWCKYVLRKAVEKYVPKEVVWRQNKMGFPFPHREWLISTKMSVKNNLMMLDCPWINASKLFHNYDLLVNIAPVKLWRLISVMLWWRRVIEDRQIYV